MSDEDLMTDVLDEETLDLGDFDASQWNDFAMDQGWGDGFPLVAPTEDLVGKFVEYCSQCGDGGMSR
jgi:hypothetical protein